MKYGIVLAAALAAAVSGCAAPLVRPDPLAWQSKVTHAVNWQELAQRAVTALPSSAPSAEKVPIYVEAAQPDTKFGRAFKGFVEEQLLAANYPVAANRATAGAVLQFDVQWMVYDDVDGNEKPLTSYASLYTTAAAIGGQLRHISSVDTGLGAGLVAGPVLDLLAALNDQTNAEVVLTTKIEDPANVHYLRTETFYVKPTDLAFYMPPQPELPMVTLVVGSQDR